MLNPNLELFTCECLGNYSASICDVCIKQCHNFDGCKKLLLDSFELNNNEDKEKINNFNCDCGKSNHHLSRVNLEKVTKVCFYGDIHEYCLPKEFYSWVGRSQSEFKTPNKLEKSKSNFIRKETSKIY